VSGQAGDRAGGTRADPARAGLAGCVRELVRAAAGTGYVPLSSVEAEELLRSLAERLVQALFAEPFQTGPGEEVGLALVAAEFLAPEMLGRTVSVLGSRLLSDLGADTAKLRRRLAALLGGVSAGYARGLRDRVSNDQESIARAMDQARHVAEQAARRSASIPGRPPPNLPALTGEAIPDPSRPGAAAPTVGQYDHRGAMVGGNRIGTEVTNPAALTAELKILRKGRGILVARIGERVGPALRALAGVAADTSTAELRRGLAELLERPAGQLPDDLRVAALVALGLYPDARLPFYQERIRWLAGYLQRDERTARRRVDQALEQLAELASAAAARPNADLPGEADGWYVDELRCVIVLDRAAPETFEYLKVTATRDDISELELPFTLPRDPATPDTPDDLVAEVVYGGGLRPPPRESANPSGFVLELPSPLKRYECAEVMLRCHQSPGQPMRQHHVLLPHRRCDLFDLRVRFDPDRPPRRVWQVPQTFHHGPDKGATHGKDVPLDAASEIHLKYRNLRPALSYGIQWLNPEPD
jgi:hypothetical protein